MLKIKLLQDEHIVSALIRSKIQMAFPSNNALLQYVNLNCARPKPFDLCGQIYDAACITSVEPLEQFNTLLSSTGWAIWRICLTDMQLREAISDKSNANLRQSELFFNRNWKYCTHCIAEDKKKFGVSYWHNKHQLPSITHCTQHNVPLFIAPKMKTFQDLVLPQYILPSTTENIANSQVLLDWSHFIVSTFELLKDKEELGNYLRNALVNTLSFPSNKVVKINEQCMDYMDQFENDMEQELLRHLFRYYNRDTRKRRLNLIKSILLCDDNVTVRNPVYFLVILYWVKNKSEFRSNLNEIEFAA